MQQNTPKIGIYSNNFEQAHAFVPETYSNEKLKFPIKSIKLIGFSHTHTQQRSFTICKIFNSIHKYVISWLVTTSSDDWRARSTGYCGFCSSLSSPNINKIDWPVCDAWTSSEKHFNKLGIIHNKNIPLIHTFDLSLSLALYRAVVFPTTFRCIIFAVRFISFPNASQSADKINGFYRMTNGR